MAYDAGAIREVKEMVGVCREKGCCCEVAANSTARCAYHAEKCRHWQEANPEKHREACRHWQEANPEKRRKYSRHWQEANPEKHREACRHWRDANPEKQRKYYEENRLSINLRSLKNNALRRNLDVTSSDEHLLNVMLQECVYCKLTGKDMRSPLEKQTNTVGVDRKDSDAGYHDWNEQPCCQWHNASKGGMSHEQYEQHLIQAPKELEFMDNQLKERIAANA